MESRFNHAITFCFIASFYMVGIGPNEEVLAAIPSKINRSPVDVVLSADETWMVSVNQTSNSISLIGLPERKVIDELEIGDHPSSAVLGRDGKSVWVTCTYSGELVGCAIESGKLRSLARVQLDFHPTGIAMLPGTSLAYVALAAANQVAVVDLEQRKVVRSIDVGRWPRYLAISPDGKRLVVGASGDRGISIVDLEAGKMLQLVNRFKGLNIGHVQFSQDSKFVYFPWMHYGENIPSQLNIRRGWVIGNKLARLEVADPDNRGVLSLDKEGEAVGDAFGLTISNDEQRLAISAAGTHEVLLFRFADIPYTTVGSSEHIAPELLKDPERFSRIPVGGRPLGLKFAKDNRTVYVANYLENTVQIIDAESRSVTSSIELGGEKEASSIRKGEAIFYDARRSFDQWYSCHSCHYEGGTNSEIIDTLNDGSAYTFKTVLPLFNLRETGPWTWHGYQSDVFDATQKSLITTMIGKKPAPEDVRDLVDYLQALSPPPNPHFPKNGRLSDAAARGKQVFEGEKANCIHCHKGPHFTDGEIHDVGLGSSKDRYKGYNTPTLHGVYGKVRLLHDGRARSLDDLLTGPHNPDKVTGRGELTEAERADLIEYLRTL